MIKKYRYGAPFDTEALTEKIETAEEAFPYGEISQKEGFAFTYIMDEDDIVYGEFEPLYRDDEQIFAYIRKQEQEKLLTVCNFSERNAEMEIPEEFKGAECLITNLDRTVFEGKIVLKPYEAFVLYK